MRGREYLEVARELVRGTTEKHWRAAAGRAYHALMLEGRDALFRWGFKLPPRENVHTFVGLRFDYPAHPDLKVIGHTLEMAGRLRNKADYDLSPMSEFSSDARAQQILIDVTLRIDELDAIDADLARRAAAVAAIRAAFP
jgi:hypothetical protein